MAGRRSSHLNFWNGLQSGYETNVMRITQRTGNAQVTGRKFGWFLFAGSSPLAMIASFRDTPNGADLAMSSVLNLSSPQTITLAAVGGSGVSATVQTNGCVFPGAGSSLEFWEFTENYVVSLAEKIKAAIDADTVIQAAYAPKVIILLSEDIRRFEQNSKFRDNVVVIHSLRDGAPVLAGSGRYDWPMFVTITFYTRSSKGVVGDKEINLVGDATINRPGLYELAEDVKQLLIDNYLETAAQRFLWRSAIPGDVTPEDVLNKKFRGDVVKASMVVEAHKYQYTA